MVPKRLRAKLHRAGWGPREEPRVQAPRELGLLQEGLPGPHPLGEMPTPGPGVWVHHRPTGVCQPDSFAGASVAAEGTQVQRQLWTRWGRWFPAAARRRQERKAPSGARSGFGLGSPPLPQAGAPVLIPPRSGLSLLRPRPGRWSPWPSTDGAPHPRLSCPPGACSTIRVR